MKGMPRTGGLIDIARSAVRMALAEQEDKGHPGGRVIAEELAKADRALWKAQLEFNHP